jgi:hypothetical protein
MLRVDIAAAWLVPTFGIAGNYADVAMIQTGRFKFADGKFCGSIIAINACECLGHVVFL